MAETRSKRPRLSNTYFSPDSSISSVPDRVGRIKAPKNREAPVAPPRSKNASTKSKAKKSTPTKPKLQRTVKNRQLSESSNAGSSSSGPADSSVMDLKEQETGEESPPVLTEIGGEMDATVQIQLPDENEANMPSLKIEEPGSPLIVPDGNETGKNVEGMPPQPTTESIKNAWVSDEESSDGSVGCVEVNETESKDKNMEQDSQMAFISEEFIEQYTPLASTPVSQQPSLPCTPMSQQSPLPCTSMSQQSTLPCTPISEQPPLDCTAKSKQPPPLLRVTLQESVKSEPLVESVEEVLITEVKKVVFPSIPGTPNSVDGADLGFNMSVEELKKAENLYSQQIATISQQLAEVEAKMEEVDLKRTSVQATFKTAYEEFQASMEMFTGFQSAAEKLRKEISSKSQEARRLLKDKREADLLALKSEINFKELELMSLKSLLKVKQQNLDSDPQNIGPRLNSDERMTAAWNEIASKNQLYEDLRIQHEAVQGEETKLKEELRAVFSEMNRSRNICDEAGKKTKTAQIEMNRLKETWGQCQSQQKRKSIELLDAKDNLLEMETRRKRKQLQIEREKLAHSDPSDSSSRNPQSTSCQVQIASQSTTSDTPVVRRIRRMHSSVYEVVDYSSQQVESQSPPSSGQPEQIVIRTSYDLNVRTVQLFKP